MAQRDLFHETVRVALERDGWTITHDPYTVAFRATKLYIDLGAEIPLAAEKSGEKIAVEVKTFLSPSPMLDLERALGQFALYKLAIDIEEPGRVLFLALPEPAFELLLADELGQRLIAAQELRLAVFDPELEVITRWID